ncbi:1-acyl-sn-glycerol-3-phosphate acyltransferase [Ktedonosporobacter rubrisoli]|uniref:1-acyl-sn-glycerol-3-phosphate acyltransferase n=2 Tax=Ktedonosporobacter rubrisoli TaxID=2509675 RepID=A0A4P6K5V9_KTERU|nr:1-acyl-sn-glycerol-3-phosphate acyltransferase [Ktedonosporobacter rubrisoli]
MYRFLAIVAYLIIPRFFRVKVTGKEHVPQQGGIVLTCNHISWLDVILLAFVVLPRPIHYMAKKELFQQKLVAWFLRSMHAFPVDRQKPGPSALKIPLAALQSGEVVGIFPSGTRASEDAALKQGAVTIAMRAKSPLIVAVYQGPKRFKLSYLWHRPSISMHFWPALLIPNEGDRKQAQAMVMQQLSLLLGSEPGSKEAQPDFSAQSLPGN